MAGHKLTLQKMAGHNAGDNGLLMLDIKVVSIPEVLSLTVLPRGDDRRNSGTGTGYNR